jgi:NAD(P)-dependent dehydrogenase (short-subunit alcohol dehydrogenase family)
MKSVLVTGSSSGIGRATVERLAQDGWKVFAAVRDRADVPAAGAGAGEVVPIVLDVTEIKSLEAAAAEVREATAGTLDALVSNAGIPVGGALEAVEPEQLREILDVNVVGAVAIAQVLLPLLRAARGRILIVGSLGGRVAFPFAGPYHASKFALEGLADSLRAELRPQGITVGLIEPGPVATPIWAKAREQVAVQRAALDEERRPLYDERLRGFEDSLRSAEEKGEPPSKVAEKIAGALEGGGARYPVGRGARTLVTLRHLLPDPVFDRLAGLVSR